MTALAVDHDRDHALALQGAQAAQARAVLHFTEDETLPTLNWTIREQSSVLRGLLSCNLGDVAKQVTDFQAWCTRLKATPNESVKLGLLEMHVEGWQHGVLVHVWTRVPAVEAVAS